ncbi:hypothetical protein EG358_08250 [Chryseobacterium indoltheticum]|nr:hypothetical protein EG358_08250 [Chryseobacterium indoltheticum]
MINKLPEILTKEKYNEKDIEFRNALFNLDKNIITDNNAEFLTTIYQSTKHLDIRNKILKLLYDFNFSALKEFFLSSYKKERYLDMKIYALRGLSQFIEEKETLEQVNIQYDAMPDAFKDHYTVDETGEIVMLKSHSETKRIMDKYWEDEKKNLG